MAPILYIGLMIPLTITKCFLYLYILKASYFIEHLLWFAFMKVFKLVTYLFLVIETTRLFIKNVTVVEAEWLPQIAPHRFAVL